MSLERICYKFANNYSLNEKQNFYGQNSCCHFLTPVQDNFARIIFTLSIDTIFVFAKHPFFYSRHVKMRFTRNVLARNALQDYNGKV